VQSIDPAEWPLQIRQAREAFRLAMRDAVREAEATEIVGVSVDGSVRLAMRGDLAVTRIDINPSRLSDHDEDSLADQLLSAYETALESQHDYQAGLVLKHLSR
jgi:DNA-binding protein YbaB